MVNKQTKFPLAVLISPGFRIKLSQAYEKGQKEGTVTTSFSCWIEEILRKGMGDY